VTALLLDTTFLVDADRGRETLDAAIGDEDDIAIAAVTAAELALGVLVSSSGHRDARRRFFESITAMVPIITYDLAVALEHAALLAEVRRQGRSRGAHDLIIAATAKTTERTVVTADIEAFTGLPGVKVREYR
jgi:tRNA(fMet)-specific endonuclease VapC